MALTPDQARRYRQSPKGKATRAKWVAKNIDQVRTYGLNHYNRNKAAYSAKYFATRDLGKLRARGANWRAANLDKARARGREWARRNPECGRKWRRNNPEKRRASARAYSAKLRSTIQGNISHRLSSSMRLALRGAKSGRGWESLVGYTVSDLHKHIESNFEAGMNWSRFMLGQIHIDHVIPKCKFSYTSTDDPEFKRCWALENLQPKWKKVNLSKGGKILSPQQIALGI